MANYFRKLPDLDYPSLLNDRKSSSDTVRVKNLFRRAKLREDFFSRFISFTKYKIVGDDRPDTVSEKIYGSPNLDWVILLVNNIIDIKNDWPMTDYDLNVYLTDKYTEDQLVKVHHYETIEFRDLNNRLITPAGKIVDENFIVEYLKGSQLVKASPTRSVSYFEWEVQKNEDKRNINIPKPDIISTIVSDFERIMKYDRSSQYVNKTLKKTENTRITG
jgi:hypothetical protein